MVATEQYFPRGGKKPKVGLNDKKKYDFLGNSDKIGKKKKYRPRIIQKNVEKDLDYLSDISYEDDDGSIKALSAEKLSNKTIHEGMVLLGRISSISDTKLTVSLPSRLFGFIMASHISVPYTKLLQSYVNDEIENIKSLDELYAVGEYLNVKVISTTQKDDRVIPAFSMMPQDVNTGTTFLSVRDGDILRGAVESVEDHGYVIDLGINNCRTFLPLKWAEKNFSINVGQVIWCVVKKCVTSANNSIITVTNKLNSLNTSCISGERIQNYSVSDLKPGMAVDFYVSKPLKDGAEGYVLSNNSVGYVHTSQIGNRLLVGKTVKAYLLYVMQITKLPFFTTREIFKNFQPDMNEEKPHKEGSIIESANVSKAFANIVIFKSENSVFMMPKKFSNHKDEENLVNFYQRGSEHTIRVMNYCLSDYAYICSDDEKLLKQKHFSYYDFSIGELVEVVVKTVSEKGVLVEVESLKGWIPSLHMSDVGLNWSSKSDGKKVNIITKKFKIGEKVPTRVLRVDPNKSQLHLTAKPTLLSPDFKILSSYEDAEIGTQYKGTVETVFKAGILVTFFNGICAFVHRNELSHEKVENIQDIVNIGQIVNCTVISVNVDDKKMICSLIRSASQSNAENDNSNKKKKKNIKNKPNEISDDSNKKISESPKLKSENKNIEKKNITTVKNDNSVSESEKDLDSQNIKTKKKKKGEKHNIGNESDSISPLNKTSKKNQQNAETSSGNSSNFTITENVKDDNHNESRENKSKRKRKIENEEGNESLKSKKKNKECAAISDEKSEEKKLEFVTQFSSMANFWNLDASTITENVNKNAPDSSSSESEEDNIVEENIKKKKKRLTNAEKVKKAREDEEKLRQIEKDLMEVDSQPKSSDQFDRLLLANPNSSELWIAYMAFHLQATEVDRARAIAKKAINVISFREEHEKMNVWLALLNLENRFGTKESLNSTLQDAIQMNDSFKIHSKMLDMYAETGKINELTSLVDTMLAKYKQNPDTYMCTGESCYKLNLVDKARAIMQKAISRLDNKQHVPVLTKFAQLENSNGDTERAETLFEQMIGCMPQRVDICGVYIDMLMKSKKIDNARFVLERAISHKLNARKMKFLFKKWIELEEKFGDPDKIEKVRQMALEYIEKITDQL